MMPKNKKGKKPKHKQNQQRRQAAVENPKSPTPAPSTTKGKQSPNATKAYGQASTVTKKQIWSKMAQNNPSPGSTRLYDFSAHSSQEEHHDDVDMKDDSDSGATSASGSNQFGSGSGKISSKTDNSAASSGSSYFGSGTKRDSDGTHSPKLDHPPMSSSNRMSGDSGNLRNDFAGSASPGYDSSKYTSIYPNLPPPDTPEEYKPESSRSEREGTHGDNPARDGGMDSDDDNHGSDSDDYDKLYDANADGYKPTRYDNMATGMGIPLNMLKTTPGCSPKDITLEKSTQHYVAIKLPYVYEEDKIPDPYVAPSKWDTDHVRMPFSPESKCEYRTFRSFLQGVSNFFSPNKEEKRWEVIQKALKTLKDAEHKGPFELEEAIMKYNQRYTNKWQFTVLRRYFTKFVSSEGRAEFFDCTLPLLIDFALNLPSVCPAAIPLLKSGRAGKVKKLTLSQYQIACLLTNAFFCTFPMRNARTYRSEYANYPDINFSHLFTGDANQRKLQKLHCLIRYFTRIMRKAPTGIVTFFRQFLDPPYEWYKSPDDLTQLHVSPSGTIEDDGHGMLQVDFANKYLGGGVLGNGCVQEEIRFIICPEMIVTRLFTEALDHHESLLMTGCERFSLYDGYSDSFVWKADYEDRTQRDILGRLCCDVVAIDAQVFRNDYKKQFRQDCIERELNKAYCGFKTNVKEANRTAVCTGNWGCGAFGGDIQLKALIQIMAASVAKRDVCYFTFGNEQLATDLHKVHKRLRGRRKSVSDVFGMLNYYNRLEMGWDTPSSLFDFIHKQLDRDRHTPYDNRLTSYDRHTSSENRSSSSRNSSSWDKSQSSGGSGHNYPRHGRHGSKKY